MKQQPARTQRRRRPAGETREHVLDVAHELFYWTGIRATGIDRIAADAHVAPTALYRAFASKDELVTAYVERAERGYREWFDQATADDGRSPAERILGLFDALGEQVRPAVCRGCPFSMALTEFPDEEVAAHQIAVRLKEWVRGRLHRLAKAHVAARSDNTDAALLGDHLTLLFEGVYASVQALGARGPAKRARQAVVSLLDAG